MVIIVEQIGVYLLKSWLFFVLHNIKQLLCSFERAHTPERSTICTVETFNLKFIEFDIKFLYKLLKHVLVLIHQFLCLLFSKNAVKVGGRLFKIWKEKDEDLLFVSWYFYQVHLILDHVEVSIENWPLFFNPILIVSHI